MLPWHRGMVLSNMPSLQFNVHERTVHSVGTLPCVYDPLSRELHVKSSPAGKFIFGMPFFLPCSVRVSNTQASRVVLCKQGPGSFRAVFPFAQLKAVNCRRHWNEWRSLVSTNPMTEDFEQADDDRSLTCEQICNGTRQGSRLLDRIFWTTRNVFTRQF